MPPRRPLDVLIEQLDHRYRVLARSLGEGLDDSLARRQLGSRPPILWHGAHLMEAMGSTLEAVCRGPGGAPLPPEFKLAADRDPALARHARCKLVDLRDETLSLGATLLAELRALSPAAPDTAPLVPVHSAFDGALGSRAVWLEGHVFHVTYHLGAMGLLRAEWGLNLPTSDTTPSHI